MQTFNRFDVILQNDEIMQKVCMFDYIGLQNRLDSLNNNQNETFNVNIFKKPYILFKLNMLYEAYIELENISNAIKDKNNILFVVSEYNRLQVGDFISENDLGLLKNKGNIEKELQRIRNSINQIDINLLIENYLTEDEQKIIKNKLNGNDFLIYKNEILKLSDNVDKKQIYSSGVKELHIELFQQYVLNYIFIKYNKEFKDLQYYSIKEILLYEKNIVENNKQDNIETSHIFERKPKEYNCDYFAIYLMIEYLQTKQIEEMFDIVNVDVMPFKDKEKLLFSYENLINSIIKLKLQDDYSFREYVRKFFVIFSKIELTKEEFTSILKLYLKAIRNYSIYSNDAYLYKHLMDFIIKQFNDTNRKNSVNIEILEKLLTVIYEKTIKFANKDNFLIRNSLNRVVRNLSNIILILDKNYIINIKNLFRYEDEYYLENFYIPMYSILDKTSKNKIRKAVKLNLDKLFNTDIFYLACYKKIIKKIDKYEDNLLNDVILKVNQYYNLKENPKTEEHDGKVWKILPDHEKREAENALSTVADLINFGIIKNKQKYFSLLKYNDFDSYNYLSFVCDMQNFDYNNFEVSFLHYLTPQKTRELKNLVKLNKSVKNIIKEKVLTKINIDGKFNDIYIKNRIFYILFNEPYSTLIN